jgi:radical SAM superfamily enzyme YgiQ (UPF0313 family)
MDVLILYPSSFRKNYGDYAAAAGRSQPLGICYIAAVLEKNGINVGILDADILNLTFEQTIEEINNKNPKILMIPIVTTTYNDVLELAKMLKKRNPHLKIIVGGPHLTIDPESTLKNECFDVGVLGEAEYTTLELVQRMLKKENISNIKGIIYTTKNGLVKNPPRGLIPNLDELPMPAYHLLPSIDLYHPQIHSYRYKPVISMITSRGCPYRCIYCDQGIFGKMFRGISGKKVVDQIEELQKRYGIREVTFCDDTFTLNKRRIWDMCDEIKKRKLKVAWSCITRADHLDKDLLKRMKDAGCWMIMIGIESGNQEILDFIKKDIKLEKIREVTDWAYELGIKIRGFFQIGHPKETKQTIEDTINFAKSLNIYAAEFTISTPFKGTELYEIAKDYGTFDASDESHFSKMFPVFTPNGLTQEFLLKKQKELHRRYYLRPKKILEFALLIRSPDDIKRYWSGAKILLK